MTGIGLLVSSGIRINLSSSMPAGFYRLTDARIERGALVVAYPDLPSGNATGARARLSDLRLGL